MRPWMLKWGSSETWSSVVLLVVFCPTEVEWSNEIAKPSGAIDFRIDVNNITTVWTADWWKENVNKKQVQVGEKSGIYASDCKTVLI